jgi:geranylgeranyl transferase type-2 subunit alpha
VCYLTHPTPDDDSSTSSPKVEDTQQSHLMYVKEILRSELELCVQFLLLDERNFHCWNYRRFVVALLGSCGGRSTSGTARNATEDLEAKSDVNLFSGSWYSWLVHQSQVSMGAQILPSAFALSSNRGSNCKGTPNFAKAIITLSQAELDEIIINEWNFTNSKIQDNFSNGSAFHYRSKLLPLMLESKLASSHGVSSDGSSGGCSPATRYAGTLVFARDEWENILLNAIFTEPDDQTPWWYHRFIVSWMKPSADVGDELVLEYETLLFEMADSLRDLLEVEKENNMLGNIVDGDESKGAKCKWAYIGLHMVLSTLLESKTLDEGEAANLRQEAGECLAELTNIDPNRRERYQNLAAEIIRA